MRRIKDSFYKQKFNLFYKKVLINQESFRPHLVKSLSDSIKRVGLRRNMMIIFQQHAIKAPDTTIGKLHATPDQQTSSRGSSTRNRIQDKGM